MLGVGVSRSTSHATSVEHFFGKNLTLWASIQPDEPSAAGGHRGLRSGTGHRCVDNPPASQQSLQAHRLHHPTIHRTPYSEGDAAAPFKPDRDVSVYPIYPY